MTRDEHRAKCIEAIGGALAKLGIFISYAQATAAFDALDGIAFVNSPEPQELTRLGYSLLTIKRWIRMAAAGDLTNPPEEKP